MQKGMKVTLHASNQNLPSDVVSGWLTMPQLELEIARIEKYRPGSYLSPPPIIWQT